MEIEIRKLGAKDKTPMHLLLQADPSEEMVNRYLFAGDTYLAWTGDQLVGVFILMPNTEEEIELKNIAIEEAYRRKGIGKELVNYVIRISKMEGFQYLIAKTADTSTDQIKFYESLRFKPYFVVKGHFIKYYKEPIMENGKQAIDQIVLRRKL